GQAIKLLRVALKNHMLASRPVVAPIMEALRRVLEPVSSRTGTTPSPNAETIAEQNILRALSYKRNLPPNDRDALSIHIRQQVIPAVRSFYEFLVSEYFPLCPEQASLASWHNGRGLYAELVKRYTTTTESPESVELYGVQRVAELKPQVNVSAGAVFSSPDAMLEAYKRTLARVQQLLPTVVKPAPDLKLNVQPVKEGPTARFMVPGIGQTGSAIFVNVANPHEHPLSEVVPLVLHEGVPGHALQSAFAQHPSITPLLSQLELFYTNGNAYVEGWALYAESLGSDMHLYQDSGSQAGYLRLQLVRAARVVVDTGICRHNWSSDRAKAYFARVTGEPDDQVKEEISRTVWPGSQLAYLVGQQQFEILRETAQRKVGAAFDPARFHSVVLSWGPLPLAVLAHRMDDCLDEPECRADLTR
ncbi:MAG TPA: DUF885 domain-containing protein, partial [Bryobacteraceae bacterium]